MMMLEVILPQGEVYQLKTRSAVELVSGRGTYGNGSIDWVPEGLTVAEIAAQISKTPDSILAAVVNGRLLPLDAFISYNCTLQWVRASDAAGQAMLKRTGAFLLAYGLIGLQKGYRRLGGGWTEAGVYYDFLPPAGGMAEADLSGCRLAVAQAIAGNERIMVKKVSYYEAVKHFAQLGETDILRCMAESDDGGAVSLQVLGNFVQLDAGLLVQDLQKLHGFEVVGLDWVGADCHLMGKLMF